MYSHEIERLLKIKQYVLEYTEYFEVLSTSPQINHVSYNKENDDFKINTDDNYNFVFKVKGKTRNNS